MSVFIGSTTQSQRNCLSKEFKKLYAKKTFIPRKQKIAIALNTCDVGIKGIPLSKDLGKQIELLKKRKARLDKAIRENKGEDIIKANQYAFMRKLQDVQRLSNQL
jgi:hypothetical protein